MRLTPPELIDRARRGERLVMVTAYDAPSARLAEAAGIDLLLVGDSAGTTILGLDSTVPVTMTDMLVLTRAVSRGAARAMVVADMPFGSFQISEDKAVANAVRFARAGADAVKLEGAGRTLTRISGIVEAGIPVMGHVGLTPQSATKLGGYRAQGRTAGAARHLVDEAVALERAGCFAIVIEAVPPAVAARITESVTVPTIGIGAGAQCSGQVLVWHDLLGLIPGDVPRFVKAYADGATVIREALERFAQEVRDGTFPDASHTYGMPDAERARFENAPAASRRR
jgi:3-methyl-2-oxobutanoate hydroxymethyltransferase